MIKASRNRVQRGSTLLTLATFLTAAFLLSLSSVSTVRGQAPESPSVPSRPARNVRIQGQVSLSNGRPAGVVRVRLTTRGGVPRETFTNDQGRFEFPDMEDGGYVLTASSADTQLVSEAVQADTSHTASGSLTVNLTLHAAEETDKHPKASVISIEETNQNIPREARKAFSQGLKFKERNDPDKALASFIRAVELYPDYFQALSERGDSYIQQRKLTDAATDFDRALKVNPRYAPALRGAGYCKLEQKDFVHALQDFEKSISEDPANASTHLLLGITNLELDKPEAAKTSLLKALSFNPPAIRAHIYLGNLYAKEHLYIQAAEELRKYMAADPTTPDRANLEAVETRWRSLATKP